MLKQSANTLVMVRPEHFGFNPETADTNPYQHDAKALHVDPQHITTTAIKEFETMVQILRSHGMTVLVLPSKPEVITPDAVFPNNWFSHHHDGKLVLYPMLAPNRRHERRKAELIHLLNDNGIAITSTLDLRKDEEEGKFLESTGSMVLDRVNKVAFAMASPRTNEEEFRTWCRAMDYEGVYIETPKSHFNEVYHTNLIMSIGTDFAVICLDVIEDDSVKEQIRELLEDLGKECIEISLEQVYAYCGNILEVQSQDGKKYIVMSETAKKAFNKTQLESLAKHGEIVSISIPTIEQVGGGGVRCMLAEVF